MCMSWLLLILIVSMHGSTMKFTTICFTAHLIHRYDDQFIPLLRQFLLIPNRNNKFMDLRANCPTPHLKQFYCDLINTWLFVTFYLFNSQLNLTGTWLKH